MFPEPVYGSETRRITALAFLAAVGIALYVLESIIPLPLPFLKIGLANVSSLVSLVLFGKGGMFTVVVARILAGSFLTGSLFTPSFLVGLSAGITSAVTMTAAHALGPRIFGVTGVSLVGSVTHVLTQLAVVMAMFVRNESLLVLTPVLLTSALVGGMLVAWLSSRMILIMRKEPRSEA